MHRHYPFRNSEASTPGVCASDRFEYGIGRYGWLANLFDDGMFHRCGLIIQADRNIKRHEKCRGTRWHDVVCSSKQVYIVGPVFILDAALAFVHCRSYEFDLQLETRPHGEPALGGCGMQTHVQARWQVALVARRAPPPVDAEALDKLSARMRHGNEFITQTQL